MIIKMSLIAYVENVTIRLRIQNYSLIGSNIINFNKSVLCQRFYVFFNEIGIIGSDVSMVLCRLTVALKFVIPRVL